MILDKIVCFVGKKVSPKRNYIYFTAFLLYDTAVHPLISAKEHLRFV